jgi:hypothetical protein
MATVATVTMIFSGAPEKENHSRGNYNPVQEMYRD